MSFVRSRMLLLGRPALQARYSAVRGYSSASREYEHILTSTPKPGVGLITFNRPKKLNSLCTPLIHELNDALRKMDDAKDIGAMVMTGSEKAFAAGADIAEMQNLTFSDAYGNDFIASWSSTTTTLKKPLISAVNGFALGGGCELAMMADILYCSAQAKFGQPEISLGIIPGAGGSQRLTRAVGKSKAMEMILTAEFMGGKEAEQKGLSAKCFDTAQECLDGAIATAAKTASFSKITVKAAKEVVNKSQELSLKEGVDFERRLFHGLFGSQDQKIGMTAFVEKNKKPGWSNS
ncbi:MAG: hypothetical protein M1828_001881 [Chrysothrix sp. TS-e1954]|nr:MAG: hypothetical protein M1828_001881 [Chrysothrix sp. TS-e1954]